MSEDLVSALDPVPTPPAGAPGKRTPGRAGRDLPAASGSGWVWARWSSVRCSRRSASASCSSWRPRCCSAPPRWSPPCAASEPGRPCRRCCSAASRPSSWRTCGARTRCSCPRPHRPGLPGLAAGRRGTGTARPGPAGTPGRPSRRRRAAAAARAASSRRRRAVTTSVVPSSTAAATTSTKPKRNGENSGTTTARQTQPDPDGGGQVATGPAGRPLPGRSCRRRGDGSRARRRVLAHTSSSSASLCRSSSSTAETYEAVVFPRAPSRRGRPRPHRSRRP